MNTQPVVLIVDDNPGNIQVLAEALRSDYRIKVAGGGQMALDIIAKQGPPDLILLDVMMPQPDGYEVCRRLKQDSACKNVPVIFVTARSDTQDEALGLRLGAVDYIVKPFRLPIVLARVRNHIALKLKADLLEMHALLDGLTNIHNRRRFDESFASEWKRALRGSTPLSLIMLDIDYFKPYNDNYGHGAGDDCLRKVAATLAAAAERPGDLVARYGGEEFVVLLPETDEEGAARIAEHLRSQVEALQLPHGHSAAAAWLTVSAGVSCIVPQPDSQPDCQPATLLEQTDSMLYRCKQSGRNRVCRWSRRVSQDPEAEGSREGRPAPTFT